MKLAWKLLPDIIRSRATITTGLCSSARMCYLQHHRILLNILLCWQFSVAGAFRGTYVQKCYHGEQGLLPAARR